MPPTLIVGGAIVCVAGFVGLWETSPHWRHPVIFLYFLAFSTLFYPEFDLLRSPSMRLAWNSAEIMTDECGAGLAVIFIGGLSSWILFTPKFPWLSPTFSRASAFPSSSCSSIPSLPICDADELESGERREGMFMGVSNLLNKIAQAATVGLSGIIITSTGFVDGATAQSPEAILRLRLVYSWFRPSSPWSASSSPWDFL